MSKFWCRGEQSCQMLPPHRWDAAALAQARPAAQTSSTVVLASLPVAAAQVSAAGTPWHSGPLASRHTCLPQLTHPHLLTQPDSSQAQVRYLLRVTVARSLGGSVVKDHAFWVRNTQEVPPPGPPIKVRCSGLLCRAVNEQKLFEYNTQERCPFAELVLGSNCSTTAHLLPDHWPHRWRWASRTACTSSLSTTGARTTCRTRCWGASTSCWWVGCSFARVLLFMSTRLPVETAHHISSHPAPFGGAETFCSLGPAPEHALHGCPAGYPPQ